MVGEKLKMLRKQHNMYQSDLADELHVSQATVAAWEKGTRRPDIEMLVQIAEYFGISTDELLGVERKDTDQELWEIREQLRRNPPMRVLFSLSKNATAEEVQKTVDILNIMRRESGHYDD